MNKEILEYSLCKRLYDAGVRVETEKYRTEKSYIKWELKPVEITKIPKVSIVDWLELMKEQENLIYYCSWDWTIDIVQYELFESKTLKDVVEKSLVYLLDNKLLWN
jgi:hypothetical protein